MKNHLKSLLLLTLLSLAMLQFRIYKTHNYFYVFLVWNLFLAYVPLFITTLMKRIPFPKIVFALLFLIWLAFLPNAPYILTDLMHLSKRSTMTIWYDTLLILTFAANGLLAYYSSLQQMRLQLMRFFNLKTIQILYVFIAFLNGFGIYLGRFSRWNSWDIIHNPAILFQEIFEYIKHPMQYQNIWIFTISLGSLLAIGARSFIRHNPKEYIIE